MCALFRGGKAPGEGHHQRHIQRRGGGTGLTSTRTHTGDRSLSADERSELPEEEERERVEKSGTAGGKDRSLVSPC